MRESRGDLLTGLTSVCEAKKLKGGKWWSSLEASIISDMIFETWVLQKKMFDHSLTQYSSSKSSYLMGFLTKVKREGLLGFYGDMGLLASFVGVVVGTLKGIFWLREQGDARLGAWGLGRVVGRAW